MDSSRGPNLSSTDLLLVNPMAGGGRSSAILPALQNFAVHRGWKLETFIANSPGDLSDKARGAAQSGFGRIFVLGGDGTFQILLNAVADQPDMVLGIVPAGGGNDLAAALGLPPDPIRAASLLLDGEVSTIDAARIRTADGAERLYCGGGGVGLDAEAARRANHSYRRIRGRGRYLLAAIHSLLDFHPFAVQVRFCAGNEQYFETNALLVGVLNTPSYGAGLYLAPAAEIDDGLLELAVVEELSLLEILRLLPGLASQGSLKTKKLRRFKVTQVRIETETPLWFHGDGELLGRTPVEVTVVPRAVRILRPRHRTRT